MSSGSKPQKDGIGYILDQEKLIDERVSSHMKPLVTCVLEGQERSIRKLDEVINLMKMTSTNRLLIWILGFVDIATLVLIFLLFQRL